MEAKFTSNSDKFLKSLTSDLVESMEKQNDEAIKASKGYAPKNTGELASSIDGEVTADSEEITSTVYANKDYAIFQELGTSRVTGKHYLKRGVLSSVKILDGEFK
jgi:hypothetical protein